MQEAMLFPLHFLAFFPIHIDAYQFFELLEDRKKTEKNA